MYRPAGDRTFTETKLRFKSSDFMIAVAAISGILIAKLGTRVSFSEDR